MGVDDNNKEETMVTISIEIAKALAKFGTQSARGGTHTGVCLEMATEVGHVFREALRPEPPVQLVVDRLKSHHVIYSDKASADAATWIEYVLKNGWEV